MKWPDKIQIREVLPRDGLQSFDKYIETDDKVRIINRLSQTGLKDIEVTGFVHPKVIPNLADAEEVFARIDRVPGVRYRALVPNERGAQRAVAAKVDGMVGLIALSETYNSKNSNMSIAENMEQAKRMFKVADDAGIPFTMAVAMSFFCPYEGLRTLEFTLGHVQKLYDMGIRSFYLASSVGVANPRHVYELFAQATDRWPDAEFGFHLHNVNGMGLANVLAAIQGGATFIEGATCGIGGGIVMPATMGAMGNLATEDIVQMLNGAGIDTGVDFANLLDAVKEISEILGIKPYSFAGNGGTPEVVLQKGKEAPKFHPKTK